MTRRLLPHSIAFFSIPFLSMGFSMGLATGRALTEGAGSLLCTIM